MIQEKERQKKFAEFQDWFKANIRGKERAEGQIFFDRFLRAFGNMGALEAGARFEDPVKKKTGKTGFVDLIWPSRVIIELKERGTNLKKHYHQAEEYWIRLVPNRPKYMCLCNFDEFWVYDLNKQLNDPVHILKTENLENEFAALAFLFPKEEEPFFSNNNVEVTENAAKILGEMYLSLQKRKIDPEKAQRFILQLVVALFAEDVGLIPKHTLQKILKAAVESPITQKEIIALFEAMATEPVSKKPKQYKEIPYFNGGLFNKVESFELQFKELDLLADASEHDWSKVRPSIFGSIFESSMDQNARHGHGIHFTSELDIQKIVGPTIIRPLREKISKAKSKKDLALVLKEIRDFKVLDPACGSGNFLYIAFRELRRLEIEVLELIAEKEKTGQRVMVMVSPKNFYGIDTNKFGLELGKVALCIGRKLSADEFGVADNILPFDNLDENFLNEDALFIEWPKADAIIGNPPFLGKRVIRKELGDSYVERVRKHFAGVPADIDYCSYWFRLAHKSTAKHCGLVGTNSIAQGLTREATLDYIVENNGYIHNAVSTQEWSGEAAVHVSIVNWCRKEPADYLLDGKVVSTINSSLRAEGNITNAHTLDGNKGISFQGCNLIGKGFIVSEEIAKKWIQENKLNKKILKPMLDGKSTVNPNIKLDWVIDFNDMTLEEASLFYDPFAHVKKTVKPERDKNKRKAYKEQWWKFGEKRPGLRRALFGKKCYFALAQISKYTNFRAIDINILPCEATMVVASDDFFILGILNSKVHLDWVKAQSSTLEDRTRWTNTTCFETFPFPLKATEKQKNEIREIMSALEKFRISEVINRKITITDLYNKFYNEPASQLYKFHRELDEVVTKVYSWKYDPEKNYNSDLYDLNKKLFESQIVESKSMKLKK